MIKEFWLDTETTGLDKFKHGIIEIAFIIRYGDVFQGHSFKIQPFASDVIDDETMKFLGLERSELFDRTPIKPYEAYQDIKKILLSYVDKFNKHDKFVMYGYNSRFDADMFKQFFVKNDDKYYGAFFWFPPVDVMNLAADYLAGEREQLENFKLGTVARYMGIDISELILHEAMCDVRLAMKIYDKIRCERK